MTQLLFLDGWRCPLARAGGVRVGEGEGGEGFSPLPFGGREGRHGRGAGGEGLREARTAAARSTTP
jgi:hypothetical protein